MEQGEFHDARLVAVYDAAYGWSREDEFFLSMANETPQIWVVDLGSGTGRLTLALATAGHQVTGVDPAAASLAAARANLTLRPLCGSKERLQLCRIVRSNWL